MQLQVNVKRTASANQAPQPSQFGSAFLGKDIPAHRLHLHQTPGKELFERNRRERRGATCNAGKRIVQEAFLVVHTHRGYSSALWGCKTVCGPQEASDA